MPNYMASWMIIITEDEAQDVLQAARKAHELSRDPKRSLWCIEEAETGKMAVVDLSDNSVSWECEEL